MSSSIMLPKIFEEAHMHVTKLHLKDSVLSRIKPHCAKSRDIHFNFQFDFAQFNSLTRAEPYGTQWQL